MLLKALKSVHTHIYVQWMTRPLNPTHVEKYQRPHAKVKKLRRNRWLIFDELTELTVFITQHGNPARQMYANKAESLHSTPSHTHTHTPSECYYFVYCYYYRCCFTLSSLTHCCSQMCLCAFVVVSIFGSPSNLKAGITTKATINTKQRYNWVILAVSTLRWVFATDKVNRWACGSWCVCRFVGCVSVQLKAYNCTLMVTHCESCQP